MRRLKTRVDKLFDRLVFIPPQNLKLLKHYYECRLEDSEKPFSDRVNTEEHGYILLELNHLDLEIELWRLPRRIIRIDRHQLRVYWAYRMHQANARCAQFPHGRWIVKVKEYELDRDLYYAKAYFRRNPGA
jgi:hypothetical protein